MEYWKDLGIPLERYTVDTYLLQQLGLNELPAGVAIIGGAARALYQQSVLQEPAVVRDIDLVAVTDLASDDLDREELSRRFMPDDYQYGHGVSDIDLTEYFADRDLTMNEVIIIEGKILITNRGSADLENKVVRPSTKHEIWDNHVEGDEEQINDGFTSPKLMIKGLLMKSLFLEQYGKGSIEDFKLDPDDSNYDFWLIVGLNKAFQYGQAVTERFLDELISAGIVDKAYQGNPSFLADVLQENFENFEFRGYDTATELNVAGSAWSAFYDDMPEPFGPEEEHAISVWKKYPRGIKGANVTEYV